MSSTDKNYKMYRKFLDVPEHVRDKHFKNLDHGGMSSGDHFILMDDGRFLASMEVTSIRSGEIIDVIFPNDLRGVTANFINCEFTSNKIRLKSCTLDKCNVYVLGILQESVVTNTHVHTVKDSTKRDESYNSLRERPSSAKRGKRMVTMKKVDIKDSTIENGEYYDSKFSHCIVSKSRLSSCELLDTKTSSTDFHVRALFDGGEHLKSTIVTPYTNAKFIFKNNAKFDKAKIENNSDYSIGELDKIFEYDGTTKFTDSKVLHRLSGTTKFSTEIPNGTIGFGEVVKGLERLFVYFGDAEILLKSGRNLRLGKSMTRGTKNRKDYRMPYDKEFMVNNMLNIEPDKIEKVNSFIDFSKLLGIDDAKSLQSKYNELGLRTSGE